MNNEASSQEESMHPPKVDAREKSKSHADELTVAHTDSSAAQRSRDIEGGDSSHFSSSTPVTQFGDYEIVSEIARGGMGVVYKARQIRLNRIVALKMILGGQLASDDDVKRFYLEAESAASLDHPGIVPIYEIGNHDGQHFFSMGYVEGTSLANLLKEGPMAPREAAECLARICDAIQFAHDRGVIHRDLKPGNILLSTESAKGDSSTLKGRSLSQSLTVKSGAIREGEPSYQPKVTDFGLAKQTKGGSELTGTGQILGTPSYMPPEQADGKLATVGPLADVYSLGAILYCMLTGRPPFQSSNPIDTLMQVLKSQPIAPRQLNPVIPRDLETICLKAIEKQPSKRYASASALREELLRFLTGEPILARPISPIERGWRWLKRHPSAGTFAGVVLGSLGIITGVTLSSNRKLQKERDVANHATTEANEQRNAAQRRLDKAIEAVDKLLVRVASEQWAARPELQSEKKYLLEQAVGFYLSFIEESRGDTKVRTEAAKAQMRLGNVYLLLNDFDASLQSVNAAQRLFEDLMEEQPQEASIRGLCSEASILKANTLALTARYQESNDEYLASIRQADEALQLAPQNIDYKIRKLESQSSYGYFLLSFDPKKGKETIAQLMQNADEIEGKGDRYEARLAIGFALTVDAAYKLVDGNMPAAAQSYGKAAQLLETLRTQTPPSPRHSELFHHTDAIVTVQRGFLQSIGNRDKQSKREGVARMLEGISLFDRLLVINPKAFPYRMQKFQALRGISSLLRELGDEDRARASDSEADRIVEQLISENPNLEWLQGMDAMRQSLKFVQAIRDGELDGMEEIAHRLLQSSNSRQQGDVRYNVACAYALASKVNQERSEAFARRSIELLQELKEKKYFEVPARTKLLGSDGDLDALRERPDFQSFQRSLDASKTSTGST